MSIHIQPNLTYTSNFNEINTILNERFGKNEYKYIYVSIGSKWNQQTYDFKNRSGQIKRRLTNPLLQMIPNFIKDREKTLIICIDQFSDMQNRMTNFSIVKTKLDDNTDFIFYDSTEVQPLLQFIIETIHVTPENFMIVNYVRFLYSPNALEYKMENKLPYIIQKIVEPTIYKECFYQWFGYQPNLYNMIYNYSRYKQLICFSAILHTFDTLLDCNLLSQENIEYVYNHYKSQFNTIGHFEMFLKNVVDISAYYSNVREGDGNFYYSLMESL